MTDWERLYELVGSGDAIVCAVMYGAAFAWFCTPFVARRKYALSAGAAFSGALALLWAIPVEMGNVTVYGASTLAGFLVLYRLEPRRRRQKAYLAVTFFSVRWLTVAIGNCLYVWRYKVSLQAPHFSESPELQFRCFLSNVVWKDVVDLVLLLAISRVIGKAYRYREEEVGRNEFLLMLLPSLSGLVGYAMMKFYDSNYRADTGYDLSEISTRFNLMGLCYYVISLMTIVVLIVLYQNIWEKQEEAKQKELLNGQIESMKHHIGRVERLYADIRGLRHDMGNHVATLEALCERDKGAAAGEYLEELKRTLQQADNEVKSGNPVTDVILSERKQEAQEEGIAFTCDFRYPRGDNVNAFDVSIILNNALDNAIRAAKAVVKAGGCPRILVRSYARNDVYVLEVENDYDNRRETGGGKDGAEGRMEWRGARQPKGMPAGEHDGREHGYGLRNIRKVAQKYCGDMSVERRDGVFRLSVMLVQ